MLWQVVQDDAGTTFRSLSRAGPTTAVGSPHPCEHRMEPQSLQLFKNQGSFARKIPSVFSRRAVQVIRACIPLC